jgi:hypothetical protein
MKFKHFIQFEITISDNEINRVIYNYLFTKFMVSTNISSFFFFKFFIQFEIGFFCFYFSVTLNKLF